ncbi:PGN_0703 family putative restriction endonuclease [Pseudoduganella aquatica]|uniref:PGN_0703 family putative restriction endonuclease n=1 Tax=Pseudoduganella aquatica TaxID=2660641 RepID=UPI001E2E9490|nr:hypothetical protein [Pseudoduganella aquatica]
MNASDLRSLIGTLPDEGRAKRRIRFHQGWWRAVVLGEPEGANPANKDARVCNTVTGGLQSRANFLSPLAEWAVKETLREREVHAAGLFDMDRLYNNLLSSQPLAFNFFGDLKKDLDLATRVLQKLFPSVDAVEAVRFEFAPKERYTGDNSAFDVAFEISAGGRRGLLGLECKYTDSFSPKEYRRAEYQAIAAASASFRDPLDSYFDSRFNQLMRNQLIAESCVQKGHYDFRMTGLFCFDGDQDAIETGLAFRDKLSDGVDSFRVITYGDFISALQQLELTWERREWSMLLWARYCGLRLSARVFDPAQPLPL